MVIFMNKKKKNTKNNKHCDFLDMSYRKNIDIDKNQEYNDEELHLLIKELHTQLDGLDDLYKKYYSSNAYIERIYKRTFFDILQAKTKSITMFKNIINKKRI